MTDKTAKIMAKEIAKKSRSVNPDGSNNVSSWSGAIDADNISCHQIILRIPLAAK
ncbi:MAG: hypothetical protein PVI43_06320 [Candidatus Bathyarchaeota archaeon]